MILTLDNAKVPMRLVYQLSEELKNDPQQVALAQALTLDSSRPKMGLRGTYGLFGSLQWWKSIAEGVMPLRQVSGVVTRVYVSGQDSSEGYNTFDLLTSDDETLAESFYANDESNFCLFKVGHRVEIVYALDELKSQPDLGGKINVSEIVLEIAVSEVPAF